MARITSRDLPDRLDDNGEPVWETVSQESAEAVVLSVPGQQFVGKFAGEELIEPENGESFERFLFRDVNGELKALNQSYQLRNALKNVAEGDWVRVTFIKEIPTKRGLAPLKDMRVEVARQK